VTTIEAGTLPRLKERYLNVLRPQLQEELGLANVMQVPRLEKIVLNCGVGRAPSSSPSSRAPSATSS